MTKILLALTGAVLLAVPAAHAQRGRSVSGGSHPAAVSTSARSYTSGIRRGYSNHGGGGRYYGGGHRYGRNYYLGGVGYYYPFYGSGLGFGYPSYAYDGFYGGGPYGYGEAGAYRGRVADQDDSDDRRGGSAERQGASLPSAVQRQLAKRGFYKGKVDGQFGPASRSALSRFQRENDLKETGRIDEDTLEALGFSDHR